MNYKLKLVSLLSVIILLIIHTIAWGQNNLDNIDNYNDSVKTMAIMPFSLNVGRNGLKTDTSALMEKKASIRKSFLLQRNLYKWFEINKKRCKIIFKDTNTTDSLLQKTGLPFDELFRLNEGALCKYLGVDAVIYCTIRMSNPGFNSDSAFLSDVRTQSLTNSIGNDVISFKVGNTITYKLSVFDSTGKETWRHCTVKNANNSDNNSDGLLNAFLYYCYKKLPFMKAITKNDKL